MNGTRQRACLGTKLQKVTVDCMCGCHRKVNINVWPGTKRMPRMKAAYCKKLEQERFGDFFLY